MKKQTWLKTGFILYCIFTLWLLFDRSMADTGDMTYWEYVKSSLILTPGRTIKLFWNVIFYPDSYIQNHGLEWYLSSRAHAVRNLLGNVILFLPLGFFPPAIWPKLRKWWKTVLCAAGVMTVLELLQGLSLRGTCDIDDVILNTLGAWIGYFVFYLAKKCWKNRKTK